MDGETSPETAGEPSPARAAPAGTQLSDSWTLWAHLPHDTDWTLKSYKQIMTFSTAEEAVGLMLALPEALVRNCMLFVMREGVVPTWEDAKNRNGGSFSFKVNNKSVGPVWRKLVYSLVGNTLSSSDAMRSDVNGVTISPKKNFCIIKVWMATCKYKNPSELTEIEGLSQAGCLFKKHVATS